MRPRTSHRTACPNTGVERLTGLAAALLLATGAAAADWQAADLEFFEREVRPVLATHCASCHSESNAMSGLRLDSREAVLAGGTRGPAATPGLPQESLLVQAVRHESIQMPLGGRLPASSVASLAEWVRRGLPWPPEAARSEGAGIAQQYQAMRREHWAFQPVRDPALPDARQDGWGDHPVDRFVLARLQERGLQPNGPARRGDLIRRLSFVLTGLPPSPRLVSEFVRDGSAEAYSRAVDRLLDSPHFGERWARHWMDVMRFGETLGNDWNYENNGAWLYRDYLIRAFNGDVPYDQLVREHIAGDLLDEPRLGAAGEVNESVIGTFFFRLGEQGHDDCTMFRAVRTDVVDDQIDTLGKAFQGLTVACARCHDHKLDPIPTADYYSIYGMLDSSRMVTRTVDTPAADASLKAAMARAKEAIRSELAGYWLAEADDLQRHLLASLAEPQPPPGAGTRVLAPDRTERVRELAEGAGTDLGNPLLAWATLAWPKAAAADSSPSEAWDRLTARYRRQSRWNARFNQESFVVAADFGAASTPGWHAEGRAFESGPAAAGAFAVAPSGAEAVSGVFPAGLYTHLLSEQLNGALRSPHLPRDRKYLSLRVVGGKLAAWRTVLDNCMLSERYALLDQVEFGWIKIPLREEHDEYPIYAELVTKHDNPRLPDRPGRLKDVSNQQLEDPRSYFGVTRAVLHDCDELPEDEYRFLEELFAPGPPSSAEHLAARYSSIARQSVEAWRDGGATDEQARWLRWLLSNGLLANSKHLTPQLRESVDRYRALERQLGAARVVQGMADLEGGRDARIFRAGDPEDRGEPVPRGFLSLLRGDDRPTRPAGSGRLEAAEIIASESNPLTARVMTNRIWHHLFGRGLVATVDNLGRFGERPSHPDLLDYLATRFVEDGWSVKQSIRRIVTSRTFQQASDAPSAASEADANNELLHRYPARRLEAEAIRDAILAVSGRLDPTLFGPSVHPYREKPKPYRKLLSGPLDGGGRRSIYLKVTRHEGASFLEALDFPPPAAARGRRDVTNVPRQALALMNDRFVLDQAGFWAQSLIKERSESVETRLLTMYSAALGRPPKRAESERMASLARELGGLHGVPPEELLDSLPVWRDMAHAVFNLKEFIYLR